MIPKIQSTIHASPWTLIMKNIRDMFINAKLCTYSSSFTLVCTIQEKECHNKQQILKDQTMNTGCSHSFRQVRNEVCLMASLNFSQSAFRSNTTLRKIPKLKSLSERGYITHNNTHSASRR